MSKDSNNWRDDLWGRYAGLFDGRLPFRTGIASLPDGWRVNVATLLESLEQIVRAERLGRLTINGLRHHDGMLAVEYVLVGFRLESMAVTTIDLAQARAACSCSVCGKAAKRYAYGSDIDVRCDTHRRPGSVEIARNWPLIRIERAIAEGISRIVRCRLYDRDSDRFMDVDPETLGILSTS